MHATTLQRHLAEFNEKVQRAVDSSQSILNQSIENTGRHLDGRIDAITTYSNKVSESLNTSCSPSFSSFKVDCYYVRRTYAGK